jgi:hypothetical protein
MSDDEDQAERYGALLDEVKQNGGVVTVNMGRLRDVHGAGKLGNIVVESIAEQLKGVGLGHVPTALPTSQWMPVIVYRNGTPVARLIGAVNKVEEGSADIIRQFANTGKNADSAIVRKIRELVCD